MKEWMDKTFPGKFESYVDYDRAQRLHTLLTELNLWHAVKSEAEDNCEFSNPSIKSAGVIHNMLAIVRMLSKPTLSIWTRVMDVIARWH